MSATSPPANRPTLSGYCRSFTVRPRAAGLWLRMTLTDGEELEGLAANDRSLVDGTGLLLTPPDTRSNTQRIYIPRQAIQTLEVVSLIGAAARKRGAATARSRSSSRRTPTPSKARFRYNLIR